MMLARSGLLVLCVIAALAAGAAADSWILDSVLSGDLGTLDLRTEVSFDGQIYHYEYELTATAVVSPINVFGVMNPCGRSFGGPGNEGAYIDFVNPIPDPHSDYVGWHHGVLFSGGTALFYYESAYGPGRVAAKVGGAGRSGPAARGDALGMVPEPGLVSLVGLACLGLVGWRRARG
jgi:hypothetical protein